MTIIITGFSSDIGKSLVEGYIKEKKTVFCIGRKNEFFLDSDNVEFQKFYFLDFNSNSFELDLKKLFDQLNPGEIETIIHAAADAGRREKLKI